MLVKANDGTVVAYCSEATEPESAPVVTTTSAHGRTVPSVIQRMELIYNMSRMPFAAKSPWPSVHSLSAMNKAETIATLDRLRKEFAKLGLEVPDQRRRLYGRVAVYHNPKAFKVELANGTVDRQRQAGYVMLHDVATSAAVEQGYENGYVPYSIFNSKAIWAVLNGPKVLKVYTADTLSVQEFKFIRLALQRGVDVDVIVTSDVDKEVIRLHHVSNGTHPLAQMITVPAELKQAYWALKFQYNDRIQPRVQLQLRKIQHLKWKPDQTAFESYVVSYEEERLRLATLKEQVAALTPEEQAYIRAYDLYPATLTHLDQLQEMLDTLKFYMAHQDMFPLPENVKVFRNLPVEIPGEDTPEKEMQDIIAMGLIDFE